MKATAVSPSAHLLSRFPPFLPSSLLVFILLSSLLAGCAQQAAPQDDIEALRQQAFVQDLLDENTRLRDSNEELQRVLIVNEADLAAKNETLRAFIGTLRERSPADRPNPPSRIPIEDIAVLPDEVVINVRGAIPATVTPTHSMDPLIDASSKLLVIAPRDERDINLGDIVGYRCDSCGGTVLHRVVAYGRDAEGAFYVMQGDNNPAPDPDKVRFSQIETVVIGIIY